MDITIFPSRLHGTIKAIPSKSQAHRLLICAAFADRETLLICPETNQDIEATVNCLNALGASILRTDSGYCVHPIQNLPVSSILPCGESGSTLRFMLPIVGALGVDATFLLEGRLPQRPLSPLWEEMERMGCQLERPHHNKIHCSGQLHSGSYQISGKISSQFITGLLFAMALMDGTSNLVITDTLESKPYVDMTRNALQSFGVNAATNTISGSRPFQSPGTINVEGDWSNAAFFLAAAAMGNNITVTNLDFHSAQGDKAVFRILKHLDDQNTIHAADIPDLIPILSVAAAGKNGAKFTNIQRLRLKESDRVAAILEMLSALEIHAVSDETTLTVFPGNSPAVWSTAKTITESLWQQQLRQQ